MLGVLWPAWKVPDLDDSWQDSRQPEATLYIAWLTVNEPLLGPRLMAAAHKR